jgi:hypothetical protein
VKLPLKSLEGVRACTKAIELYVDKFTLQINTGVLEQGASGAPTCSQEEVPPAVSHVTQFIGQFVG